LYKYVIAQCVPFDHSSHKNERHDNDERADTDDDDIVKNIVDAIGGDDHRDIVTVQPVRNGWRRRST
jgi:hypothetical protein